MKAVGHRQLQLPWWVSEQKFSCKLLSESADVMTGENARTFNKQIDIFKLDVCLVYLDYYQLTSNLYIKLLFAYVIFFFFFLVDRFSVILLCFVLLFKFFKIWSDL